MAIVLHEDAVRVGQRLLPALLLQARLGAVGEECDPHLPNRFILSGQVFQPLEAVGVLLCRCLQIPLAKALVTSALVPQGIFQSLTVLALELCFGETFLAQGLSEEGLLILWLDGQAAVNILASSLPRLQADVSLRPVREQSGLQGALFLLHLRQSVKGLRIQPDGLVRVSLLQRRISRILELKHHADHPLSRRLLTFWQFVYHHLGW
mmetsp:Transcript_110880/g.213710  ORF Transcript_110880/g.213710 Transcript_110880/m.213710 type:complete len:208 (+) Transcript_110880:960-1583(+)